MKVLIIKLGALGDLIIATAFIQNILRHHADDEVFLLTTNDYANLLSGWAGLRVKALPRRGTLALWHMLSWIRGGDFSVLYDLQSNNRTAILSLFSGIPKRVGNGFLPYTHHPARADDESLHIFRRIDLVLKSAGLPATRAKPSLPIIQKDNTYVADWFTKHSMQGRLIAILHAGSSTKGAGRRWPYFAEIALALVARNYCVIWIGSTHEASLNAVLAKRCGIDATGEFSIPQLIALGKNARLAIANDSAPMHALSCSGIPVYGIFRQEKLRHLERWQRSSAVGQQHNVIAALPGEHWPSPVRVLQKLARDQCWL